MLRSSVSSRLFALLVVVVGHALWARGSRAAEPAHGDEPENGLQLSELVGYRIVPFQTNGVSSLPPPANGVPPMTIAVPFTTAEALSLHVDFGARLNRWFFGAYADVAPLMTCPGPGSCRESSGLGLRVGAQARYQLRPGRQIDPGVGVALGVSRDTAEWTMPGFPLPINGALSAPFTTKLVRYNVLDAVVDGHVNWHLSPRFAVGALVGIAFAVPIHYTMEQIGNLSTTLDLRKSPGFGALFGVTMKQTF